MEWENDIGIEMYADEYANEDGELCLQYVWGVFPIRASLPHMWAIIKFCGT